MKKITIKTLTLVLIAGFPISAFAAIAHDATQGENEGSGTSISLSSVVPTGSNRLLVCSIGAATEGTTVSSGPTFGGSAFTQLGSYVDTTDGYASFSSWYLVAPSTSSGTVSATLSNSTSWVIFCDSYTGVDQTTPFANITTGGSTPSLITTTPTNVTRTSSVTGSWQFTSAKEDSASTPLTISAGGTRRQISPTSGTVTAAQFDSNGGVSNGSNNTMTLDWTGGGQKMGYISAMMVPLTDSSVTGSGTIGRLAKFSATSTITSALLSDDGTSTTLTSGNFLMPVNSVLDTITTGALNFGTSFATLITFGRSGQVAAFNSSVGVGTTTPSAPLEVVGTAKVGNLSTATNCSSNTSPASCGSASAGSVAISAGSQTLVVDTSAVASTSQIFITEDSSLGSRLGVTCNTTVGRSYSVSARSAGSDFTIKSSGDIATNPACLSYFIVN